jgi:signal transduction histidine kinase
MKLWHKVFLGTFLLFELLFNASSFYLIEHHFNQNLKNEVDRGLSEQLIIVAQITSDWSYISAPDRQLTMSGGAGDFLKNNGAKYIRYLDRVSLEILDGHSSAVFSSFMGAVPGDRAELAGLQGGSRQYVVRDGGGKTYLFVSGIMTLDGADYKLTYIRDITGVYTDKASQVSLFFKLNAVITVLLAAGLYALVLFLTRSVRSMAKSAQTIAGGDYSQRVEVLSGDEIGELARSFNRMADAVESKVDELEVTAKSRQRFIECLTHELKTPLTSIIGYAEFLRGAKYNEEVFFKALTYIYTEGKRLESLSFKLMDLILAGRKKPEKTCEDVAALCLEIQETVRPRLETSGVTLSASLGRQTLSVERELFTLLCTNLIDNAIKASKPGGTIFLRGGAEEAGYVLEIEDEGIGISDADIPRVFEPFFVADKARSKAHHSAGLGLAICAEIVRLHEGSIQISSRLKVGTVVRIVFPK